jgi:hypothetical protein
MLIAEKANARQLFVATHSGDVLRGLLDAEQPSSTAIVTREPFSSYTGSSMPEANAKVLSESAGAESGSSSSPFEAFGIQRLMVRMTNRPEHLGESGFHL